VLHRYKLRLDCDSTAVQLPYDDISTALRPFVRRSSTLTISSWDMICMISQELINGAIDQMSK